MATTKSESVVGTSALDQAARPSASSSTPVTPSISCMALRTAVTGLTRLDDFDMDLIGAGFFANVYKVSSLLVTFAWVLLGVASTCTS